MLIASPRHTAADLAHWRRMEALDLMVARSGVLHDLEERALGSLRAFLALGPCYVSTSWGKDSTVVAHLFARIEPRERVHASLCWFPAGTIENPDCVLVRDAFMARFGASLDYQEHVADDLGDWNANEALGHDGAQAAFVRATKALGERYISGVRAEESGVRKMSLRNLGIMTARTCRPIGWWRGEHVFAYLAGHDLPVHPAYACTMGGTLDRSRIRVSTIGGELGRSHGRAEWERRYYAAELRRAARGAS